MSHYILAVTWLPRTTQSKMQKTIEEIGLEHERAHDATTAVEKLSALPIVKQVALILVNETRIGVWKKGKRT